MKAKTSSLLQHIQPLMDAIDLSNLPESLIENINRIEEKTGITTPDYAIRLLILSNEGAINDDEYIGLIFHFSQLPRFTNSWQLSGSSIRH